MQAQKRTRTRQAGLTKHREAGILLCYCPMPKVLHRYHDKEYSSGYKQLVLHVNRVALSQILTSSSDLTIIIGTDPEPRVLDVSDQLMPLIMQRERGDWTLRGSAVMEVLSCR